jgi:hypothetical protein
LGRHARLAALLRLSLLRGRCLLLLVLCDERRGGRNADGERERAQDCT